MKYFTMEEFKRSETAERYGIDNTIPDSARANIERLVADVLDPLRAAWGAPVTVTSGYRCAELNARVGGSKTSHHLTGMAADISAGNRADNRRLFQKILGLGLPFTQLIDESNFSWVHVGYDPSNVKRQILKL